MADATTMLAALPVSESKTTLESTFAAVTSTAKTVKLLLAGDLGPHSKLLQLQDAKEPADPIVTVDVIDTGDDGIDRWTMMVTITTGVTIEFSIATPLQCGYSVWDRFLNHGARSIGRVDLRDAWITMASDRDDKEVLYELRTYTPVTCTSLIIPGRILLPKLRAAIQRLFAK
jgi:hypothetical protein